MSRIIPSGRVEAYDGERVVQVFNQEAPFPEGLMLKTEGRCGVRMDEFYLVADDKTIFGIHHQSSDRVLTIEQGMVYLALSQLPGNLIFRTPDGVFPARQIFVQAAADQGVMKAYLDVQPDRTEIGVLEGGHMTVSTPEGDRRIAPGRQITIAQALIFDEEGEDAGATEETPEAEQSSQETEQPTETPEQTTQKPRTGAYVGVGLAALAIIGGALALGGGGGGSSGGSSGGGNGSVSPVD